MSEETTVKGFGELGLSDGILQTLDELGQAQTGSGKTAAFGLPMLEYLDPENHETQAFVLTPTRELCIQVTQAMRAYA